MPGPGQIGRVEAGGQFLSLRETPRATCAHPSENWAALKLFPSLDKK
jgi:hypothetical protein